MGGYLNICSGIAWEVQSQASLCISQSGMLDSGAGNLKERSGNTVFPCPLAWGSGAVRVWGP